MTAPEIAPSQLRDGEYYIGRNTIVMCKLKHGKRKQDSPLAVRDYIVMTVYGKFYNKWKLSSEKKKWCLGMDKTEQKSIDLPCGWLKMELWKLMMMYV